MKYRDEDGQFKTLSVKVSDTLPIGSIVEIPDDVEIPSGYEEVEDSNKIKSIDASEIITPATGFSLHSSKLIKQENHYSGYVIMSKSSNFTDGQEEIATINKTFNSDYNMFGVSGPGGASYIWSIPNNLAYIYIRWDGKILAKAEKTDSYIKFYINVLAD